MRVACHCLQFYISSSPSFKARHMIRQSLFSGILIGLGAYGFLVLGGIPGAVIFSFGLLCVIYFGVPLYTGKAGFIDDLRELAQIWFFNALGCMIVGLVALYLGGEPHLRAVQCMESRLANPVLNVLLRAVGCGLIIDLAVWVAKTRKSMLPVLFGVPLFIVCGFYHSIADVVYIFAAGQWSPTLLWYYPLIVVGNYLGCNLRRVMLKSDWQ